MTRRNLCPKNGSNFERCWQRFHGLFQGSSQRPRNTCFWDRQVNDNDMHNMCFLDEKHDMNVLHFTLNMCIMKASYMTQIMCVMHDLKVFENIAGVVNEFGRLLHFHARKRR